MRAEDFTEATRRERRPVRHPLVRRHGRNGRGSLHLASHVIGRQVAEGRAPLRELIEFAMQPRFAYAHARALHGLVMWDDSWTMHRATLCTASEPRVLRWCGVRELEPV